MATLQKINDLQITYSKSWAGLTTENHLSSIFQIEPALFSDIVTRVFSQMNYEGIMSFINKYPVKVMDTDIEYRWYLKGDDRKAINIIGYSAQGSSTYATPGIGKTTFLLEVETRYFQESDYLWLDNKEHGVRIVGDGYANGTNWIYEVEHMRPDLTYYVPTELLTSNNKVSKAWSSTTNTLSDEGGDIQFSSHFMMENGFSTIAKQYTVPGNVHDRPMLVTAVLPDGKKTTVWTRELEMRCDWQWEIEKANNLMFAQSNRMADGTYGNVARNGFEIKQGAGLRQQISSSYKFYYTKFTLDYLQEVLMNLSINILPEDKREFLILTGERGMIQFHEAVEDKVAIVLPFGVENRVTGSGQNLGLQGQYRTYMMPQGIKVTVMKMAQYDDLIDCRIMHPEGGPIESYRMTIMNIGTSEGQPNIQRVVPKGRSELKGYVPGLVSPFGPSTGMNMVATTIDGYKVRRQTTHGIMLRNPLSCAELIYNGVTV